MKKCEDEKINEFIKDALDCDYIQSRKIEDFTIEQLDLLTEEAKENNLMVTLKAEHSNLHQGVLVNIVKKDIANKFLKWI